VKQGLLAPVPVLGPQTFPGCRRKQNKEQHLPGGSQVSGGLITPFPQSLDPEAVPEAEEVTDDDPVVEPVEETDAEVDPVPEPVLVLVPEIDEEPEPDED